MPLTKARFYSALLALSAMASPALADAQLSFAAASSTVQQGSGVDVQVFISGVTDLYGYNFTLSYDPSKLQVGSVTEGSFLSAGGATYFDGGDLSTAGTVSYTFGGLYGAVPGVSGSGVLATIHFNAIGVGSSALTFTAADTVFVNSVQDGSGFNGVISVTLNNSSLQVTAVPEPGTYLLMAAGLAGVGLWRRRQAA